MTSFNLSAWAITHRPLVHYFMAMLVILGVASYMKLGRNEDPTFTIKAHDSKDTVAGRDTQ